MNIISCIEHAWNYKIKYDSEFFLKIFTKISLMYSKSTTVMSIISINIKISNENINCHENIKDIVKVQKKN